MRKRRILPSRRQHRFSEQLVAGDAARRAAGHAMQWASFPQSRAALPELARALPKGVCAASRATADDGSARIEELDSGTHRIML